jgi:hypothetical protein
VQRWAHHHQFDYRFIDDALFDRLPNDLHAKLHARPVIAADLARLLQLRQALSAGYDTVIWCDADFLVFAPEQFLLVDSDYAVGRETWIEHDKNRPGGLRIRRKVHNAFLMFRRGNAFLDFYIETAERLLRLNRGSIPPQFIGPKLLTALHNIAQFPVQESAGMLSPLVVADIATGHGGALAEFRAASRHTVNAANLCLSLEREVPGAGATVSRCVENLLRNYSRGL